MKARHLLAITLCLLLLCPLFPIHSSAAAQDASTGFNIMIVMDCSGSLVNTPTDYHGYRYEAASMFLDLLSEKGNNVGVIAFNACKRTESSIEKGLRVDKKPIPIESKEARAELIEEIRNVEPDGYTDIGTALLRAAQYLQGMEAQNGKQSMIILFTDGVTETYEQKDHPDRNPLELPLYAQSIKNQEAALELIRQEDISLCGVYLNKENADPENSEVLRMVRIANGFNEYNTADQVGDLFISVTEASKLPDAYQRFFALISGIELKQEDEAGKDNGKDKKKEIEFRIPGTGIKEVNISISAQKDTLKKCQKVIDNLKVVITRPNGEKYTSQELASSLYRGANYAIYKITDPEPGDWKVTIDSKGETIRSSILINPTVKADASFSIAPENIKLNEPFSVTAMLTQNGQPLASEKDYQQYSCTLLVKKAKSTDEWPVELRYDSSANAFTGSLYIKEYGEYDVYTEFVCGDTIRIVTPSQCWSIVNHPPVVPENHTVPINIGLRSTGVEQIDLRKLIKEEDTEEITIALDLGDYKKDACTREGDLLTIDGVIGGSGKITAIFTDAAGGEARTEIQIDVNNHVKRDMTILQIILAVIAVVIAIILIRKWVKKRLGGTLPGTVRLTLPINGSALVPLSVNAQNTVNKNLKTVLNDNYETLLNNASNRLCSQMDIDIFLEEESSLLSAIRFTAVEDKKTGQSICRLEGLPDECQVSDLADQNSISVPLSNSHFSMSIEYNRYQ